MGKILTDKEVLTALPNPPIGKFWIAIDSDNKLKMKDSAGNIIDIGGPSTLELLSDVVLGSPLLDGQVLTYDSISGTWFNSTVSGGTAITTNYIPKGTGTSIADGTWAFSGNNIYPLVDGSNIGLTGTNRIGSIYMSSIIDFATDLHLVHAANTLVMVQGSTGRTGINTISPATTFDVSTAGINDFLRITSDSTHQGGFQIANGASPIWTIYKPDAGSLDLRFNDGADRIVFQNGGSVGIGVMSPATALHVRVAGAASGLRLDNTTYGFEIVPSGTSTLTEINTDNIGFQFTTDQGLIRFENDTPGPVIFYANANVSKFKFTADQTSAFDQLILNGGPNYNVGIGTNVPNAALDITSNTQGFLMPRMTSTQRTSIVSPATGLEVFDITTNTPYYYNGTSWVTNSGNIAGSGTVNTITKFTGTGSIGDGTWAFSGNDIYPLVDGSNIGLSGSPSHRIGTIYMASNIDFLTHLAFLENGTERARFISGGNLGLGTPAPISVLHLKANSTILGPAGINDVIRLTPNIGTGATFPSIIFDGMTTATQGGLYWSNTTSTGGAATTLAGYLINSLPTSTTSRLDFYLNNNIGTTSSGLKMRIESSGAVGINTTSPSSMLHVLDSVGNGGIISESSVSTGAAAVIASTLTTGAHVMQMFMTGPTFPYNVTTSEILLADTGILYTDSVALTLVAADVNGYMRFATGGIAGTPDNERMRIDKNGLVGIGTRSPGYKLEVYTADSDFGVVHSDGAHILATFVGTANGFTGGFLGTISNHGLAFYTNSGIPAMVIDTTKNVGIGTLTPTASLHVKGAGTTSAYTAKFINNSSVDLFLIQDDGHITAGISTDLAIGFESQLGTLGNNNGTSFGHQALRTNAGQQNSAFGSGSQLTTTSGNNNSSFGWFSLQTNTTGDNNTGFGSQSLRNLTTGSSNTGVGYGALLNVGTGSFNSAFGSGAMGSGSISGATENVAIGASTLNSITTGSYNTAVGDDAMNLLTTGSNNTAVGLQSGKNITTTNGGIFLGYKAGLYEIAANSLYIHNSLGVTDLATGKTNSLIYGVMDPTVANQRLILNAKVGINIANPTENLVVEGAIAIDSVSYRILRFSNGGTTNAVIYVPTSSSYIHTEATRHYFDDIPNTGLESMNIKLTDGVGTVNILDNSSNAILRAGYITASGNAVVGVGILAPVNNSRFQVQGIGITSATYSVNVKDSASVNLFLVRDDGVITAGKAHSLYIGSDGTGEVATSDYNTIIGNSAFTSIATGNANTGVGQNVLDANTSGTSNSAFGVNALYQNTTGNENTAMGYTCLTGNGTRNSAFGSGSLGSHVSGDFNVAVGWFALTTSTVATESTAIGASSQSGGTIGVQNTSLGYGSLGTNTTGSTNTAIGHSAGFTNIGDGNVFLGYKAGYYRTADSNRLFIHNQSTASAANDLTNSLVHGFFDPTPANQHITFNGYVGVLTGATTPTDAVQIIPNGGFQGLTVQRDYGQITIKDTAGTNSHYFLGVGSTMYFGSTGTNADHWLFVAQVPNRPWVELYVTNNKVYFFGNDYASVTNTKQDSASLSLNSEYWDGAARQLNPETTIKQVAIDTIGNYRVDIGTAFTIKNDFNVGIGTLAPNASAILDVTSTTKGVLLPRMTTAQRDAIVSPANSLLIYNTDSNQYQYHDTGVSPSAWVSLSTGSSGGSVNKYATTFTPGTVTVANTITHGLGSSDIIVQLWDVTLGDVIYPKIDNRTTTTVDITFTVNPAGDVRIVVMA